MKYKLVERVNAEEKVALAKWGEHDQSFDNLLSGALEELGEVAHTLNHNKGTESAQQEIVEVIGILSRLYDMVDSTLDSKEKVC